MMVGTNENIIKVLNFQGNELVKLMKNKLDTSNANASGKLRSSIKQQVTEQENNIVLEISGLGYGFFKSEGRAAGKFPPKDDIIKWIKQRNITSDLKPESLAFLIARKISKEGTKGNEFIKQSLDERRLSISTELAKATGRDVVATIRQFTKFSGLNKE